MIEEFTKTIDNLSISVSQLDGMQALTIQTKLLSTILPAIPDNIDSINENNIGGIFKYIDSDKLLDAAKALLSENVFIINTNTGHKTKLDIASDLIGKPFTIWKICWFVIESNFDLGNLFPAINLKGLFIKKPEKE